MKEAHSYFLKVKEMISVAGIFSEFTEPTKILTSEKFKVLENTINGEEVQIILFLTKMKDEICLKKIDKMSYIMEKEMKDLYSLYMTKSEIRTIFYEFFKELIEERNFAPDERSVFLLILELNEALELDSYFDNNINPDVIFEENQVFIKRGLMERDHLADILKSRGFKID